MLHANAVLTARQRLRLAGLVVEEKLGRALRDARAGQTVPFRASRGRPASP